MSTVKEILCVFTGAYAHNVFTDKDIPIWIADYVLMGYGTGAIMAAPGEDQRDFEFATKYSLEIPRVTAPADGTTPPQDCAFTERGITMNSGFLTGQDLRRGAQGRGEVRRTNTASARHHQLPDARLADFAATLLGSADSDRLLQDRRHRASAGRPTTGAASSHEGLSACRAPAARRSPTCRNSSTRPARNAAARPERETDTLDGFACSSWYFLRFASPHENQRPFSNTVLVPKVPT